MYNKENIMEIIDDHQKQINALEAALKEETNETVISAINNKLSFLYDNQRRYKSRARVRD